MPRRKKRGTSSELDKPDLTPLIDIIFQLMIFFLVTMSVMPAVQSARQVEGNMSLATPKQGNTEVSVVIQVYENTKTGKVEYYVLRGSDDSAKFYKKIKRSSAIMNSPDLLRRLGKRYGVYYNNRSLKDMLKEIRSNAPRVLIRAKRDLPYGKVVKVTNMIHRLGITKYAWVGGTLAELNAEIKKGRR